MRRFCVLLLLLLFAPTLSGQTTRISDRLNVDPASLDEGSEVYLLVDDATNSPTIITRKLDVRSLRNLASDKLTITAPTTLTGEESPLLLIEVDDLNDELTVPAAMSVWITNSAQSSTNLVVNSTGGSTTLKPTYSAWFRWNGAAHEVTETPTVDTAMSDSSSNPVENQVIKAYVDAAVAGGFVTQTEHDAEALVRSYDRVVDSTDDIATAAAELTTQGYGTMWIRGAVIWNVNVTIPAAVSLRGLDSTSTIIVDLPGGLQIGDSTQPLGATWGSHSGSDITNFMPDGDWVDDGTESIHSQFIAPTLTGVDEGDWVAIFCDTDLRRNTPHFGNNAAPMPYEIHQIRRIFTSGPDTVYEINGGVSEPMVPLGFTYTVDAGTDTFTAVGHNLANDDKVKFRSLAAAPDFTIHDDNLPAPIDPDTEYWVIGVSGDTFQISLTQGGAAVDITTTGTAGFEQLVHNLGFPAKVWELPIEKNNGGTNGSRVIIDNLAFVSPSNQQAAFLLLRHLNGVEITRCRWDFATGDGAAARLSIDHCANVEVHHNIVEANGQLPVDNTGDFVWVGRTNGFNIHHNVIANVRNAVQTTPDQRTIQGVVRRPGTALNTVIHHNLIWQDVLRSTGSPVKTAAILLTDCGYQVRVEENTIHLRRAVDGAGASTRGVESHARESQIVRNSFIGHAGGIGVDLFAGRQLVAGNEFRAVTDAVHQWGSAVASGTQAFYGSVVTGNKVYDAFEGNAVAVWEGNNLRVLGNEFHGVVGRCVVLSAGSGHLVSGNLFVDAKQPDTPSEIVQILDTATASTIAGNRFVNCWTEGTTAGDAINMDDTEDIVVMGNEFVSCNFVNYVSLVDDCNTISIYDNTAPQGLNTNFLSTGATVVAADLEVSGNNVRGYGSGSIGVTGTDSANINTAFTDDNWVDD